MQKVNVKYRDKEVTGQRLKFETEQEEWCTYRLEDGTRMRIKLVVVDVVRLDEVNPTTGEPVYLVKSQNIVNPEIPDNLKVKSDEPEQTH